MVGTRTYRDTPPLRKITTHQVPSPTLTVCVRAREEPLADPSAHLRAESSQRACATADRGGLLCGPMASVDPRVGAVYRCSSLLLHCRTWKRPVQKLL